MFEATNGNRFAHLPGMAVSIAGATVVAAIANGLDVDAFSAGTVMPGTLGTYQSTGVLEAFSRLFPSSAYFLSPTVPGAITATPPVRAGQAVQRLGIALSTTMLVIQIGEPIRL